ncbi:hypothetical protein [Kaarinaea lacus]
MKGNDRQQPIDDQIFLSAAKTTLESSVEQIDDHTQARLAAIRRRAVDTAANKPPLASSVFSRWFLPVGGLATACAAVLVAVTLWTQEPEQNSAPVAVLEDLNILTGSDELEFYQELEFYEWLAANEQDVS